MMTWDEFRERVIHKWPHISPEFADAITDFGWGILNECNDHDDIIVSVNSNQCTWTLVCNTNPKVLVSKKS